MKIKRILKWSALAILLILFASFEFAYWTSTNDCDRKTGAPTHPMKAIRYCEYGPPDDVLKIEHVEKPVPNDNQILVRVRAVSLRFFDGGMLRGGIGRLIFGLRKPKNTCPGSDFSGTVGAVGRNVSEFKPGDEVLGVGADHVIDYTKEDYTKGDQRYDVIYDLVNNHSFAERRRVLKPGGICVLAGIGGSGMHDETLSRVAGVFTASLRSKFSNEKFVS